MTIAQVSALRSKDPCTQVGVCLVSLDNRIIGIGYNGFPKGCSDDEFPWSREGPSGANKYAYVVHAEVNAILNTRAPLKGCVLYTVLFPCNECTKVILQVGITKVVYLEDPYHDKWEWVAARKMLDAAGVIYIPFTGRRVTISISCVN